MTFARRLLRWFDDNGRHDLPWQHPRSAYRVWVSEIMLQQTTVRAVVPYFERFVARFPDLDSLAQAQIDEVLALWSGLGYYARARNLHKAARIVVDEHDGQLPQGIDQLRALPGIGPSTAGAILAQAFDQRHPILDGNAKRVLARHAGIAGWPGASAVSRELWAAAESRTPPDRAADYTQAIMDLGATLCRRSRPDCQACPVSDDCVARREQRQHELPGRASRRKRPQRQTQMLLCVDDQGRVLLHRRPPSGIWGGLWSLPEYSIDADPRQESRARLGVEIGTTEAMTPLAHSFTHFDLEIRPLRARALAGGVMDEKDLTWYKPGTEPAPGMPAPVVTLISRIQP